MRDDPAPMRADGPDFAAFVLALLHCAAIMMTLAAVIHIERGNRKELGQ